MSKNAKLSMTTGTESQDSRYPSVSVPEDLLKGLFEVFMALPAALGISSGPGWKWFE